MDIRIVAMDLDGTLLDGNSRLTERTKETLRRCEAKGVKMVLASGRGFESTRVFAVETGLHSPLICANGTRVEETPDGGTILEKTIPPELSEKVVSILMESGIYFVCYARGINYNIHMADERRGQVPKNAYDEQFVLKFSEDVDEMYRFGAANAYKYVAFTKDLKALEKLRKRLETETDAKVMSSWWDNVEIIPRDGGKGQALAFLRERYGCTRDQVMAFGDAMNDWDMMREAGWPVAMGNAVDELKAAARLITAPNTEEGVAQALEKYVLNGEDAAI